MIEQQTNKNFEIKLQRKQCKNKYLLCKHNMSQTRILVGINALQKNNKIKSFQQTKLRKPTLNNANQ